MEKKFPSLRGSFGRRVASVEVVDCASFHPLEEVSEGASPRRQAPYRRRFHPLEEVSEVLPCSCLLHGRAQFPSLRGSFGSQNAQGLSLRARRFPSLRGSFERRPLKDIFVELQTFPSLRGSFERRDDCACITLRQRVSIPQRKFRKRGEGPLHRGPEDVSIPQRKLRKVSVVFTPRFRTHCFHPSEEVSKVISLSIACAFLVMFPSLRGSFESLGQGDRRFRGFHVSIPQRKFRKYFSRRSARRFCSCFHPSEEVSKASHRPSSGTPASAVSIPQRKFRKR